MIASMPPLAISLLQASTLILAAFIASSSCPMCWLKAPQQAAPADTTTSMPPRAKSRIVASLISGLITRWAQPASRMTRPVLTPVGDAVPGPLKRPRAGPVEWCKIDHCGEFGKIECAQCLGHPAAQWRRPHRPPEAAGIGHDLRQRTPNETVFQTAVCRFFRCAYERSRRDAYSRRLMDTSSCTKSTRDSGRCEPIPRASHRGLSQACP